MTLVITSSNQPGKSPRLRLDVDSTPAGPLPVPDGSAVAVYRIHEDGTRYQVITEPGARLTSGAWSGFDYCPPFNQQVSYVAVAAGQESAAILDYAWSNTAWLIHPSVPDLSVQVEMVTDVSDISRKATAARHDVFQQKARFISGESRKGVTGTLSILTDSVEQETAAYRLLDDDTQILINTPYDRDLTWMWVHLGDETHSNPGLKVTTGFRVITYTFEETDQPDVDLTPSWTCGDVVAEFATCGAVLAAFATCEDLALDVR